MNNATISWVKNLTIACALALLVGLIVLSMIPTVNVCRTKAIYANTGNHLREMVLQVLEMHDQGQAWPTSTTEYLEQCRAANLKDGLQLKAQRVFVAWEQFLRAEAEKQVLPVCVLAVDGKAVVGFTDGHYETITRARLEKIFPDGLAALSSDKR